LLPPTRSPPPAQTGLCQALGLEGQVFSAVQRHHIRVTPGTCTEQQHARTITDVLGLATRARTREYRRAAVVPRRRRPLRGPVVSSLALVRAGPMHTHQYGLGTLHTDTQIRTSTTWVHTPPHMRPREGHARTYQRATALVREDWARLQSPECMDAPSPKPRTFITVAWSRLSTCPSPPSPRHAQPDWMGGGLFRRT
jgi:hypothetical protein